MSDPRETTITLAQQRGEFPTMTIDGEAAADVEGFWISGTGPGGISVSLNRLKVEDGEEWRASDEYVVTEITMTAKVVRR